MNITFHEDCPRKATYTDIELHSDGYSVEGYSGGDLLFTISNERFDAGFLAEFIKKLRGELSAITLKNSGIIK